MPPTKGTPYVTPKTRGPLAEYYLRNNKDAPLEGPYTFYQAEYRARTATRLKIETAMEMVVLLGTRQGDPPQTENPDIRVVAVYVLGRKTLGGNLAQYNSERGNT